jgi:hypothetical protein
MRRLAAALLTLILIHVTPALSQAAPGLSTTVNDGPTLAVANPLGCDVHESPYQGQHDDPAAFDDRAWITTPRSSDGQVVATMQEARQDGAIHFATSPDLLRWSAAARLMSAIGAGSWLRGDPTPVAHPAVLAPARADRNFKTFGDDPSLF